jgi:5'-nucleotidase
MTDSPAVDWSVVDTVLLDMDGTLLDLRFDNWFWQELIPLRYSEARGLTKEHSIAALGPKFRAAMGTLDWYCIEYWSRELDLDIAAIKRSVREEVEYLPGAERFLRSLKLMGKRRILVTNAHPQTLAIKNEHVDLDRHLEASYSTHRFAAPKEHADFWPRLLAAASFDPRRTLFIDDSLPVLQAARAFGIAHLRAVRRPDSTRPAKFTGDFAAINGVAELLD